MTELLGAGRANIGNLLENWDGDFCELQRATGATVKELSRISRLPIGLVKSWAKAGIVPAQFRDYLRSCGLTRTAQFDDQGRVYIRRDGRPVLTGFLSESERSFIDR